MNLSYHPKILLPSIHTERYSRTRRKAGVQVLSFCPTTPDEGPQGTSLGRRAGAQASLQSVLAQSPERRRDSDAQCLHLCPDEKAECWCGGWAGSGRMSTRCANMRWAGTLAVGGNASAPTRHTQNRHMLGVAQVWLRSQSTSSQPTLASRATGLPRQGLPEKGSAEPVGTEKGTVSA